MERRPELTVERPSPGLPALALFVPLSLLGGIFPAFSLSANLYVLVLGGVLLAVGLSSRMPRRAAPAKLPPGIVWWLVPVLLFAVVETATYFLGSTYDYPTLSLLADPLLDGYLVRSLAYFGWLAAFWGLVRR
jgi:hypothetical protein